VFSHINAQALRMAPRRSLQNHARMPRISSLPGHRALRRGRHSLPGNTYVITFTTRDRVAWFTSFEPARAASAALATAAGKTDAEILAWVLMPDHAHLLVTLGTRWSLQRLVQQLKSSMAREVNRAVGRRGPLWSRAFHDHALRNEEDLRLVARYIVLNPVRAGLVARCADYPFWDAAWITHRPRLSAPHR
jgi:REP element-mobilizing transposase RayT